VTSSAHPRSRYPGWPIAWALAVTQTVGYGVLFYAYAVLTLPMELELGLRRSDTSGAFSLGLLIAGLAALPIGRFVDRFGARGIMTIGSLLAGGLVFAWSYVHDLTGLYLVQAGIGLVMAAVTYEVAFAVIARWFRRDRIRALLIVTLVAGLASTIFVPLTTVLTETLGWRAALRVLAGILWVATVPLHGLVLRRDPEPLGWTRDGRSVAGDAAADLAAEHETVERSIGARDAWRRGTFWWLTGAFALDRMVTVAVGAHAVPLLLERGHAAGWVATAAGSIGLLQVAGRLIFAPATRRYSLAHLAIATNLVRAASLLAVWLLPGVVGMWTFAVLFGLANGAATLARAGLVAETYGPAHYGTINGSMTTAVALLQTVAPLAVGALRVTTGGYGWGLAMLTLLALFAALAIEVPRRQHNLSAAPS